MSKPPDTKSNSHPPLEPDEATSNAPIHSDYDKYYTLYTLPSTPAAKPPPGFSRPVGGKQAPNTGNFAKPMSSHTRKHRFVKRSAHKYASLSLKGKIMLGMLLVAILIPSVIIIFEGINAYILYSQAMGGIHHLQDAQRRFESGPSDSMARYFDVNKLHLAQQDVNAAQGDFQQLSNELDHDGSVGIAGNLLPQQVTSARALAHIGVDATQMLQRVLKSAIKLSPSVTLGLNTIGDQTTTGPLKPLIDQVGLAEIDADINYMLPLIQDMNRRSRSVALDTLPFSDNQRHTIASTLQVLPATEVGLTLLHQNINELGWILGVDGPRKFLVEPMDRAELRATGGFTGQFGELDINGAHMGSLQLKNIGAYEEDHSNLPGGSGPINQDLYNNKILGHRAPDPYNAWWPIDNFGMRDANVSADFPKSAGFIMNAYNYEFGTQLDGVIIFTPFLIENVLRVVGPIKIPRYNETITAQNLEDRLHYYQLDNDGIYREMALEHIKDSEQARKMFTQRVTQTLMSTVQHSSPDKILHLVNLIGTATKEKNLQIYMTNPQVESLIGKYGSTTQMDRSTDHDGIYIVQSNLSANKASQYTTTTVKDNITLDASGTAIHHMQITLDYQQKGPVNGPDTYNNYIRVYVPPTSQFKSGNGFDQPGQIYCGDPNTGYKACAENVYGDNSLVCSASPKIGDPTGYLAGKGLLGEVLDQTGEPTNKTSDESGRDMYGGWIVIPKNCTMTISLSWSVPSTGNHPYSLMFQPQASVFPQLDLTVQAAAGTCGSGSSSVHYAGTLNGEDETFTLAKNSSGCTLQKKP